MPHGATARAQIVPSSRKYDLLTAIALAGLAGGAMRETLALRLIALITARYDWARDCVTVGQAELERLWAVSRRTVIRDLAELRKIGALTLLEAGRRGRVARYRLGHDRLTAMLAPIAPRAGNSLERRLSMAPQAGLEAAPLEDTHVATPGWSDIRDAVTVEIGDAAAARWLDPLRATAGEGGDLRLAAPTRFHADYVARVHGWRLEAAALSLAGARRVVIEFVR